MGHKSVEECQQHISAREFAEWQAYDRIEPFGVDRLPFYFGTIAATIANTQRSKSTDKVYQWYDFFEPFERIETHQTVEEQIQIVEMLNAAFGGIDKRGEKASSA